MSEHTFINCFQRTCSKNTYKCCGINRNKIAKIVERLFSNSGKPFLFNENRITWQHLLNDSHLYFSFATSSSFSCSLFFLLSKADAASTHSACKIFVFILTQNCSVKKDETHLYSPLLHHCRGCGRKKGAYVIYELLLIIFSHFWWRNVKSIPIVGET